jgi:phage-related protein
MVAIYYLQILIDYTTIKLYILRSKVHNMKVKMYQTNGGKLWEIKFHRHNRIFYCLVSNQDIYLLHVCQKQKGKAEKLNLNTARKRLRDI